MSSIQQNGKSRWKPSYLRRQGQMTKAQKRYFRELWPKYGVDLPYGSLIYPEVIFSRKAPTILEIGFGQAETLLHRAQREPENNFLAVEVHKPAISTVLAQIESRELENIRLIRRDALLLLADHLRSAQFNEVWIFFPEPWPDETDRNRRLLRPQFLKLLEPHLDPSAHLYFATDVQRYAKEVFTLFQQKDNWKQISHTTSSTFSSRPHWRQLSKYESKGEKEGRSSVDLSFAYRPIQYTVSLTTTSSTGQN